MSQDKKRAAARSSSLRSRKTNLKLYGERDASPYNLKSMIIKSKRKFKDGLVGMENKGDKTLFTHVEDVTEVLENNRKLRIHDDTNGFSKDRSRRKIASIPPLVWFELTKERPELANDQKALEAYLKSEEGRKYLTVRKGI